MDNDHKTVALDFNTVAMIKRLEPHAGRVRGDLKIMTASSFDEPGGNMPAESVNVTNEGIGKLRDFLNTEFPGIAKTPDVYGIFLALPDLEMEFSIPLKAEDNAALQEEIKNNINHIGKVFYDLGHDVESVVQLEPPMIQVRVKHQKKKG